MYSGLLNQNNPEFDSLGTKPGLTIAAWAQYVLDNFASVEEAVNELKKEEFVIVSKYIPGTDKFTTLHLSISDASGDNAIFEYIEGSLVIHHNRSYQVMTNSPIFEKQLAINGIANRASPTPEGIPINNNKRNPQSRAREKCC